MRDWGGYGAVLAEAQGLADAERARPLVDCPRCGTPLSRNGDGELDCPLGHFSAPAGAMRHDYPVGA